MVDQSNPPAVESAPKSPVDTKPAAATPAFAAGHKATYRGKSVELTLVHDDETADVQEIDATGNVVRDENNQPKWTQKVPFGELA